MGRWSYFTTQSAMPLYCVTSLLWWWRVGPNGKSHQDRYRATSEAALEKGTWINAKQKRLLGSTTAMEVYDSDNGQS